MPLSVLSERGTLKYLFLSFEGRIDRPLYWVGFVVTSIPSMIGGWMCDHYRGPAMIIGLLICLAAVIPSVAVDVKRWHDLNKPGWWYFLKLVPVIGPIWAFIDLGFRRGTPGPNQFGDDPSGAEGDYQLMPHFNDLASMLHCMCRVDESLPEVKVAVVEDFFKRGLSLQQNNWQRAMHHFYNSGPTCRDFNYHARNFCGMHWENKNLLKDILRCLFYIACTDGKLSAKEKEILDQASDIFRVECDEYKK